MWQVPYTARQIAIAFTVTFSLLFNIYYVLQLIPKDKLVLSGLQRLLPAAADTQKSSSTRRFGQIQDRVAVITDTHYTARLLPLILHYHALLGPDWPIVWFTSEAVIDMHLNPSTAEEPPSAIWQQAEADGRVAVRVVDPIFNLTDRVGVNVYLSRPWLWEQLAPATHVLVFQADAMICANAHKTVDDFIEWDYIGPTMLPDKNLYNGGLSIRNRSMILDILSEGHTWESDISDGNWLVTDGEDVWFSVRMAERGAHLPEQSTCREFAAQHSFHYDVEKHPLGFHKVHKYMGGNVKEISEWCPEITLSMAGLLPG